MISNRLFVAVILLGISRAGIAASADDGACKLGQRILGFQASLSPGLSICDLVTMRDFGQVSLSPTGREVAYEIHWADPLSDAYISQWFVADPRGATTPLKIGVGGRPVWSNWRGYPIGAWVPPPAHWSPDGSRFAYLVYTDVGTEAWCLHCTFDSVATRLAVTRDRAIDFVWSESSAEVIFSREASDTEARERESYGIAYDDTLLPYVGARLDIRIRPGDPKQPPESTSRQFGYVQQYGGHPFPESSIEAVDGSGSRWTVLKAQDRYAAVAYPSVWTPCPIAKDYMVCVVEGPASPQRLVGIDLLNKHQTVIANPNAAILSKGFCRVDRFTWTTKSGSTGWGYLILPSGARRPNQRYPMVIVTYDRDGFLRGGTGDEVPIQFLAARGLAVLVTGDIEPAAVTQSVQSVTTQERETVAGLLDAIRLLDQRGLIDPKRVGISGLSYGAGLTYRAITETNAFAAAAVGSPPATDPIYYFLGGSGRGREVLGMYGIDSNPTAEPGAAWHEASYALRVNRIHAPLLMNLSDTEYALGTQLYFSLRDAGRDASLFVYPGEGHVKSSPRHRLALYVRNVAWFERWLKNPN